MQVWESEPEPEDATVALATGVEISQGRYNPALWHCGVTERAWTDGLTMQGREQNSPGSREIQGKEIMLVHSWRVSWRRWHLKASRAFWDLFPPSVNLEESHERENASSRVLAGSRWALPCRIR